jgi:hypothetical protein
MKQEEIIYTRRGKNLGVFDGEILRKNVKESVHLFKKLDGWGIDALLVETILFPANASILITDTESKKKYLITADRVMEKGTYEHYKKDGVDYGKQIVVPRYEFELASIV